MNEHRAPNPRALKRIIEITVNAIFAFVCLCSSAWAATPALSTNLLINPDAESGTTDGWISPDRRWVSASEITPHGGGKHFWPGGGDVADSSMYQDVDVSGLSSAIAAGTLYMHLSGWLANWDQYPHDRATLALHALDAAGNSLAFFSTEHRSPSWTQYRIDQPIPAATQTLRVVLRATRFVGTDDDGYFDDLSLAVSDTPGAAVKITDPSNRSYVVIGATLPLNATTLGGTDSGYFWSSSFQSVASVDQNGVVTGLTAGRTTIQARGNDSGAIGAFDVTVMVADGLVFIEPSANRILASGSSTPVTWGVIGTVSSAVLNLSTDGGLNYSTVSSISNPSTGIYDWTVPSVSGEVRNAILKLSYSGGESLSSLFSIVAPTTSTTTTTSASTSTTVGSTTTTTQGGSAVTVNLVSGWNLVGNGMGTPLTVATALGDTNKVITVWKWIASSSAWAFYTPTLSDSGAAYAASKGYAFLTSINGGEGFWVNAKSAFSIQLSGNPVPTSAFADGLVTNALPAGWSLIAIGDNKTPLAFANAIALSPPAAGTAVATSLTTLWAWDSTLSGWYFFAPSLVNAATQAAYIASKSYLDFGSKTLSPTTGFWVNKP